MSSTQRWSASNGRSPGRATAMPSAMVDIRSSCTGAPVRSDSGYAAASAACTPTTRTSGRLALIASAIPASSPPPPVGTSTVRTSGACSSTSSPQVPWPVRMSGWSKGWMNTAPVSSENCWARTSASVSESPWKSTSAPYPRVALALGIGAPSGMNTVALMPSSCAASATPWAWLPADAATTPRARSSAVRRESRR